MMRDEKPEVGITLSRPQRWERFSSYVKVAEGPDQTGLGSVGFMGQGPSETFDLPAEVLPSLLDVNLDDPAEVLAFIKRFGFLSGPDNEALLYYKLPDLPDVIREEGGVVHHTFGSALERMRPFQESARALQAAHLIRQELFDPQFSIARIREAWPRYAPWKSPSNKREATEMLKRILDIGLSYFAFEVSLPPASEGLSVTPVPRASLFGLLVLELVDSIHNDLPYRRCARCQRWFHRQEGRSKKNAFSRRDSIYCSKACARAQAQSVYYRKKKAERS
jgi:hypothetical protein